MYYFTYFLYKYICWKYNWIEFPIHRWKSPVSPRECGKSHLDTIGIRFISEWHGTWSFRLVGKIGVTPHTKLFDIDEQNTVDLQKDIFEDIEIIWSVEKCINRVEFISGFPFVLVFIRPKTFLGFLTNAEILKFTIPWFSRGIPQISFHVVYVFRYFLFYKIVYNRQIFVILGKMKI